MCGILGAFGKIESLSRVSFDRAFLTLEMRGPDDHGLFDDTFTMLGHRRLSIIDLVSGGQPMTSQDGRYTIIFNGEIYNFRRLRESLKEKYQFQTSSDTEVILAGYALYGKNVVDYIEGMFAFALYDKEKCEIFLARDPLGQKPLVYATVGETFIFASEIKALVPLIPHPLHVDEQAVSDFFSYKHIPAPRTIYEEIKKLPAGHTVTVSLLNDRLKLDTPVSYWKPQYLKQNQDISINDLRGQFIDTVRDHLESDVPVGVFLSGGIDSSSIVSAMHDAGVQAKTFTVGFTATGVDEDIRSARLVAKTFNTEHTEYLVETSDYLDTAKEVLGYTDEPFADPALISNYYVARETRKAVKVVLSGDGADELFFGYSLYQKLKNRALLSKIFPGIVKSPKSLEEYFGFQSSAFSRIIKNTASPSLGLPAYSDARVAMRMFDLEHTLPEYYLRKSDASSMMNSLEVRSPFCYRPFVDSVLSLPVEKHYRRGRGKELLRQMMAGHLPKEIIERKKQGFSRPVEQLFTEEVLADLEKQLLQMPLLNAAACLNLIKEYRKDKSHQWFLWRLLAFTWWYENAKTHLNI